MALWKTTARCFWLGGMAMAVQSGSAAGAASPLEGAWAGDRLQLVIDAAGGRVTADCATGSFSGPLKLSQSGSFTATGAFDAHQPGRQRADEVPLHVKARYEAEVSGDSMKLTILQEGAQVGEVFNLRKGASVKLVRCL